MDHATSNWNDIVNELGPGLYRYFCGAFPATSASDLVQETLIRLVQKYRAGEFDPERGTMKSFAFGIARFVRLEAQKANRKTDRNSESFDNLQDKFASEDQSGNSEVAHLRWAIRQLKPNEQEIILLLIDAEFSLEQISSALRMPVGTVKSHVHRAKENLRQIMGVKNGPQR